MNASFQGYYINLDRNGDRRARIEDQLKLFGLTEHYERVEAFDGASLPVPPEKITAGEYGCFASHVNALARGAVTGKHVHVVEDDAVLSPKFLPVLQRLQSQGVFDQLDILFTDVGIPPDSAIVSAMDRIMDNIAADSQPRNITVKLLDLNSLDWTCCTSYVVASRSVEKLKDALAADLCGTPHLPFDLRLRALVRAGQFRAFVCLPFLTSVGLELDFYSSIREPDASRLVCNVVRQTFFVNCDVGALETAVQKYCLLDNLDRRRKVMLDAIAFRMFGNFRMP